MAMQITKSTTFGVDAKYWRIQNGVIDYAATRLDIYVAGYLDKDARDAGCTALATRQLTFEGPAFVPVAEPTRAALYAAIVAMPEWSAAIEV